MTGLKMGPKHKGFPMTQSIHFDSRERKGFGSYTYQRPTGNRVYTACFENLNWDLYYKQRPKNCICTKMVGAYTLRDAQECLILIFDDEIKRNLKLGLTCI